jgi:calcineurin-like phosphoesterase family protein
MKTFFTSDPHFDHNNVIKYCERPFRDVGEMNRELIYRHNQKVGPEDRVFHLGDFSLNKRAPGLYLPQMNGTHYLIAGNHDWVHPLCYKKEKHRDKFRQIYFDAGFTTIELQELFVCAGEGNNLGPELVLHHMPYLNADSAQFDDRYAEWRPKDEGRWLLHGHVHQKWKVRGRMINVGVDVWDYAPVSLQEILAIVQK